MWTLGMFLICAPQHKYLCGFGGLSYDDVLLTCPQTQPALAGGAEGSGLQEPLSRPLP